MNILTVAQLVHKYDALTEGGVRWDIFQADKNGLFKSGALMRNGRKVLLVEERYMKWKGFISDEELKQSNAARERVCSNSL